MQEDLYQNARGSRIWIGQGMGDAVTGIGEKGSPTEDFIKFPEEDIGFSEGADVCTLDAVTQTLKFIPGTG